MAVPKRRTSKRRKNLRRSHHAVNAVATSQCPNCGGTTRPHRVCDECGWYKGRQVGKSAEEQS